MESPINRLPLGLLGFVDVKAMGESPRQLGQTVWPHLDMTPFYLCGARRIQTITLNPVPLGYTISSQVVVPDGKAWVIDNIFLQGITLIAGEVVIAAPAIFSSLGTRPHVVGEFPPEPWVDGDFVFANLRFPTPYVAASGTRFGVIVARNLPAAGKSYTMMLSITEVDA